MEQILINNILFNYTIERKKTKILKIRFKNGIICVVSPFSYTNNQIIDLIVKNEDFIIKQYNKYLLKIKKDTIIENDIVSIINKDYKVNYSNVKSFVINNTIYIRKSNIGNEKSIIKDLFKEELYKILNDYTNFYYLRMNIDKPFPKVIIKNLKATWGIYNRKNNAITYSTELLFKPIDVYHYIVVHELAHMLEFNHSNRFYAIVEEHCKNYKKLIKTLKDVNV